MTTIVSCFLANSNHRNDRNTEKYIEFGSKLINIKIPKIIYMDEKIINLFHQDEFTIFIPFKREDIYLYNLKDKITNFNVLTDNPLKDTLDYIFLQNFKTECIRKAILLNTFYTDNFMWIDFGINHLFNCSLDEFQNKILRLNNLNYGKVRIGSIIDLNIPLNKDIYRSVCWYFAGSVFGGNKDALIKFADLAKEKCLQIINEKRTLMWEVNVWYLIYMENRELFSLYKCDHNSTIIDNY